MTDVSVASHRVCAWKTYMNMRRLWHIYGVSLTRRHDAGLPTHKIGWRMQYGCVSGGETPYERRLTRQVFPARAQMTMNITSGYAVWNGTIFWSTRDMPGAA